MRVLLVEDSADVRTLLAATLREEGHEVIEAADFASAAALLAGSEACDAVVADVRLPDGSGIALADLAQDAGIPTLLCTGDIDAMVTLGRQNIRHLRKPFPLDALPHWMWEVAGYAAPRRNIQP